MIDRPITVGEMIDLAYGKSLSAENRRSGNVPVYGSNGIVGFHDAAAVVGPGIIVGRKGSVGALTYSPGPFWPIDTTYYVINKGCHDWRFLFHFLRTLGLEGLNSHSAVPGLNREDVYGIPVVPPSRDDEPIIAGVLDEVERGLSAEASAIETTEELKRATMRELFTRGLRGEAQKETEIGIVPATWTVSRLDLNAEIISSRMTYTDLDKLHSIAGTADVKVLGIKVGDMNRVGNEVMLGRAALERMLPLTIAEQRCAPPGIIVFPKRGAAIATNKKRMTAEWSVFDPNVIGVMAKRGLNQRFLFQWFQGFDLRTITEPGPTPQLNKKNLEPLLVPVPPTDEEQQEIAEILDAIDAKIGLHRQRETLLEELFRSLLHKLMANDIRVSDLNLSALATEALA